MASAQPRGEDDELRVLNAWELMEDIEGYCSAGQIWIDDETESTSPAADAHHPSP